MMNMIFLFSRIRLLVDVSNAHLKKFKSVYPALWVMNSFQPYGPFLTDLMSEAYLCFYRYFHDKCSDEIQTFTARIRYDTYTWSTYSHSLWILLIRWKFNSNIAFSRTAILWNRLLSGPFPVTTILTTSSIGISVIYLT